MSGMSTTTRPLAEQLTLLPATQIPVQFRLDEATRRRGLRHIAEIRALLERHQEHQTSTPQRRRPAA
jgi:hypothetical protein